MSRRLSPLEIDAYSGVLDRTEAARSRVIRVPPVPGKFVAITLGRYVLVTPGHAARDGRSVLLAHELVHVEQWQRLGPLRFLYRYLGSYLGGLRRGLAPFEAYRAIPLEAEARDRAAQWQRSQGM